MKAFAAGISPALAEDERIVGEYLFARHAIEYGGLPSYFLGFAWMLGDVVQAWDDAVARFDELGIANVPVLHRGPFSDAMIGDIVSRLDFSRQEGFVVRDAAPFKEAQMPTHLAKYVRPNHVQTDTHWMNAGIVKNGLA